MPILQASSIDWYPAVSLAKKNPSFEAVLKGTYIICFVFSFGGVMTWNKTFVKYMYRSWWVAQCIQRETTWLPCLSRPGKFWVFSPNSHCVFSPGWLYFYGLFKFGAKCESVCLVSGFARPSALFWLQYPFKFRAKVRASRAPESCLALASPGHMD